MKLTLMEKCKVVLILLSSATMTSSSTLGKQIEKWTSLPHEEMLGLSSGIHVHSSGLLFWTLLYRNSR